MNQFTEIGVRVVSAKKAKHLAKTKAKRAEKARALAKRAAEHEADTDTETETEADDLDVAVDALYARVIALDDEINAIIHACRLLDEREGIAIAETTETTETPKGDNQ